MITLPQHQAKQKILRKIVRSCQDLLLNSELARPTRRYLASRVDDESRMKWKFGYFPSDEHLSDLLTMVSKKELEVTKLYYPKYLDGGSSPHGHFASHNLVMPFCDEHGDIIAIVGRSLLSDEEREKVFPVLHKYNYSSGCPKDFSVYGLDKAIESILENDCVIGVEGQFDCISLHANGIHNAVAFGSAHVSSYQIYQLAKYTKNIIIMFDNDLAGQRGKTRVRKKFGSYANIKLISPPQGYKDIDEFFRSSKEIGYVIDMLKSFGSLNGKEDK